MIIIDFLLCPPNYRVPGAWVGIFIACKAVLMVEGLG